MTDVFDRAQEREQQQRDEALAAFAAANLHHGASYSHCNDCGDPIPEPRRKAVPGCTRCIDCQSLHELTR